MEPSHPVVSSRECTLDVTYTIADVVLVIAFRGEGGRRLNLAPSEAIDLGVALTHYAERAKSGWA